MERFKVLIALETIEIIVTAKNRKEAMQKAYEKLDKKKASKYIDKKQTDIL